MIQLVLGFEEARENRISKVKTFILRVLDRHYQEKIIKYCKEHSKHLPNGGKAIQEEYFKAPKVEIITQENNLYFKIFLTTTDFGKNPESIICCINATKNIKYPHLPLTEDDVWFAWGYCEESLKLIQEVLKTLNFL